MINSVVGQNVRWAQLAALQSPPAALSDQSDGSAFNNVGTSAVDASVVNPIAGGTSPALSSNMSLMLMMFGGGLGSTTGSGSTTGTGSTGGSGPATGSTGGSGPATQTVGSPDDTSTPGGSGLASMLANLQSLMATLTGGASAGSSGTSPAGNSILQDIDNVFSNLGTLVASTNAAQPPPPPTDGASGGQPSGGNDITNPGSTVDYASWGDGPAGPGGGWQQQFALAAYESGGASGPNSASAAVLQGISV